MSTQYQHIVRILGNDIPGDKKIIVGLTQIRGVGYMFANTILNTLKINPNQRMGHLSTDHIQLIEKIIKDPLSSDFPSWFLNRRKDLETGVNKHLITSDIAFTVRNDIEREKTVGSWRGYRHMYGLKVRGQRTRCTGRKGGAVGVAKGGKIMPSQAGGAGAPAAEGAAAEGAAAEGAAAETPATDTKGEKPKTESKGTVEKKESAKHEKK